MNNSDVICNSNLMREYTQIFSDITSASDDILNKYIIDFNEKIEKYSIKDNITNKNISNILSKAIEIFNIKDYDYNNKLCSFLYIKISVLLANCDKNIPSTLDNIVKLINFCTYYERCLKEEKEEKEEKINKLNTSIQFLNKEKEINKLNKLNTSIQCLNKIIIHLNNIRISLNIISLNIIKHQSNILFFEDIIIIYIKKNINNVNDEKIIKDYCLNIILLINTINNNLIKQEFNNFKLIISSKPIEVKEVKKYRLLSRFIKKPQQPTEDKTDNYFLMFYKKILEIYKNKGNCDYNNETVECINIKKLLFYIANLYHISKKNSDIIYEDEPPTIDNLNVFLAIKFGGKNKNEFINYKFENKVYRRKVRYDGKKKYIILDKTRIYIKK